MKPVLFAEDNTNYDHNGIGVLYDAISCIVTEEYNGAFDCELEYPVDGEWANEILNGRQILAKPNDVDAAHAFRIYDINKDLIPGTIIAKATSITDDLGGNLISDLTVTDATAQMALTAIKDNLIEPTIFDFVSDIQTRSSSKWTRINPLQAIAGTDGSLVDLWGGDIKRTNNTVYLYSRRGTDKVTTIRPGKNINGFSMVVSTKGLITKILPYFTYTPETIPVYHMVDDGNGTMVKQQDYDPVGVNTSNDQITVSGNVVISDKAANYAINRYSPIDFSQNDYIKSMIDAFVQIRKDEAESSPTPIDNSGFPDELHAYVIQLLNDEAAGYFIYNNPGCDEPSIEIKADMIELADSPEWNRYKNLESIQITDTVDVYVKKFNVDIEVSIQAISYDSIGERVESITAGSARNNLVESVTRSYEVKTKKLEEYVTTLENGVYNTINRTANGQARRFNGYTEPPANISSEGDLWFKELGDGNVEIYMYSGGVWQPKVTGAEVMKHLIALGIDAKDVTIVNLDASSITGGDLTVTDKFRIMHDGTPVLEVDSVTGQIKITAPNLATQEDLTNIELTPGPQGPQGPTGKGISSVTENYLASSASTGVTTSTTGWTTAIQSITTTNKYLWNYEKITYSDGSYSTTTPVVIGVYGDTGQAGSAGATGKGISSVIEYYLASTASTGVTTGTTGWSTMMQPLTTTNKYLWNYEKVTYTDASTVNTTPVVIGVYGDTGTTGPQGPQGIQGPAGTAGTSQYVHIRYSANADGSSFTTTPQSNTVYIGIAVTTSSTAPTLNTGYTWSNYKGAQGSQGIQGPAGTNGVTTYTWVKYADDTYGGNMTDTPSGKRYIGLAFNKTTATESANAGDYQWSPLYDNVSVGARNLLRDTDIAETAKTNNATGNDTWVMAASVKWWQPYDILVEKGQPYTLTFDYVLDWTGTTKTKPTAAAGIGCGIGTTNVSKGSYSADTFLTIADFWTYGQGYDSGKFEYTFTYTSSYILYFAFRALRTLTDFTGLAITISNMKLEKGNIATDWTPAPEDVQAQMNYKASTNDLLALGQIVSDMSSEINAKAGQGDLEAMVNAYNARIAQDDIDKNQLASDLSTLEGRTTLVETIANNSKLVTEFINTVITESEEGIYIANGNSSTGILIASDRISFLSNNVEVAYISNQTMQINHGIFVQSATIANFKFEAMPSNPNILAVQWVGG